MRRAAPTQPTPVAEPETQVVRPAGPETSSQFCRVTVLAPNTRMDVALPTDLTIAELVPMLVELAEQAGPLGNRAHSPGGAGVPAAWCLAAAAGAALPSGATLASLGVLDGDLLRLRRRDDAPPPPVFDDPVDAVAEAVPAEDDSGWARPADPTGGSEPVTVLPWTNRWRRAAGLTASALAGFASAALVVAARGLESEQSNLVATMIGALATLAALATGWRLVETDEHAAGVLAIVAVPLAAASGFAALPGAPGAGHLLLAAALAAAAAAAGLALLDSSAPLLVSPLVGTVLAATICALAAVLAVFEIASAGGLAAAAAATAVGLLPLLPKISIRLAGLPPPVVPTTPDEMLAADAQWEFASAEEIRHQSRLAHTYLAGLVLGTASVAAVGAIVAASTGGWAGPVFAWVVVAVLMLRSRSYATAVASGLPMLAGLFGGTVLLGGLAFTGPDLARLLGAPALLALAALAIYLVRNGQWREPSPVVRRAVDVGEAALVVATFPLALAVLDLFTLVRRL